MKRTRILTICLVAILFLAHSGCTSFGRKKISASIVRTALSTEAERLKGEPEPVARIENLTIPGPDSQIPVRVYTPEGNDPFPVLVYMHGGGWVAGTLDTHDNVCRFFAHRIPCVVISVDYRLAPEHKFPAAVEDSYAALSWAAQNAPQLNGDPKRIAVGGNSAGGNLAAAVSLMAKNQGGPPLVFQLLAYPVTNLASFNTDSYDEFGKGQGLKKMHVKWFREQYLRNESDRYSPYASPLLARDLKNLPPALVVTGEVDVLRDEGEQYAKKLQQNGVKARFIRTPGKGHAAMLWAVTSPEVRDVMDEAVEVLRAAFSK